MVMNIQSKYNKEDKEPQFDPFKFILKYIKYWPYVAVSIFIALIIAFFINNSQPPIYQAKAKFFIKEDDNNNGILNLTGLSRSLAGRGDQYVINQAVFLTSRPVADRALSRLDFNVDYFAPGFLRDTELYKNSPIHVEVDWNLPQVMGDKIRITWKDDNNFQVSFPGKLYGQYRPDAPYEEDLQLDKEKLHEFAFGEFTGHPRFNFRVVKTKNEPEGEILINLRSRGSLLSEFTGEGFLVYPIEANASILELMLNTTHPQKGADYLNTLMEVFLEMELEEKNRMAKRTVDFIDGQIAGVSDTLSYFEDNLQAFRSRNRTYNVSAESNTVFQQITNFEAELSRERFNKNYYDELTAYLMRGNLERIIVPSGLGINDPTLNSLIQNIISMQADRSNLLQTQTEASPRVRELNRKIEDTSASILEYIRSLGNTTQMRINDLEARIRSIEGQFSRLPSTEQNLVRIERGKNLNESIFNYLQQRRAEAAISMASNFASNKIVEFARPNSQPKKNKRNALYFIMAAFGFIVPVVIIFFKEVSNKRIKDLKELEEVLTVPLLAKIPERKLDTALAVMNEPRSAIAESFRALKTDISFVIPSSRKLSIAVSSTLAGEGKTFTAINLASIYALNQKKTILISCDMFKPTTLKDFKLKGKMGLSNYLSEQVDSVFDIIQPSGFPAFDIILSGPIPPNPSDLLASERFVQLLEDLKKIYDVIVLDTPPVGLISQSYEVLKHVDLVAYVLRFNFSENSFVEELNGIKVKKGLKNLYAILNVVPAKELTYKGYDYGYYKEDNKKRKLFSFGRDKAAL